MRGYKWLAVVLGNSMMGIKAIQRAIIHSLSHNKRTIHDVYEPLQMNAPFIYVLRLSAQSGAALQLERASAIRAA